MIFTREQYDNNIGKWYLDDFPVPKCDNFMFELFNLLPNHLQGKALSCGIDYANFLISKFLVIKCFGVNFVKYQLNKFSFPKNLTIQFIKEKLNA